MNYLISPNIFVLTFSPSMKPINKPLVCKYSYKNLNLFLPYSKVATFENTELTVNDIYLKIEVDNSIVYLCYNLIMYDAVLELLKLMLKSYDAD